MSKQKTAQKTLESECVNSARLLGWESGAVMGIEHAFDLCAEVDVCQFNHDCKLRDAYHYYLNEISKEYK